jgi:pilus assembly protein CpaB
VTTDPRPLLRELSRTARHHRALLAGGLAAGAVATALPILAPEPAPTLLVVAATRDLQPGTPLTAGDVAAVAVPVALAPVGALTDPDEAVGRSVAGAVRRGEALTDVRLLGAGLVRRAGLVAAPVRLADPATASLLRAGDHVDVLAAPADGRPGPATTVAAGLEVLAVPPGSPGDPDGALVVLAATPGVAARLAGAAVGSRLSVTVLGP